MDTHSRINPTGRSAEQPDGPSSGRVAFRLDEKNSGRACRRRWIARVLVGIVFLLNVQCAVQFILWPDAYVGAYQVEGASAEAMVRTVGICFLMWNATYPPVLFRPQRYRVLFAVVLAQQTIGLVGESMLLLSLDAQLGVLAGSVVRFIAFDAAGLVLMSVAFALTSSRWDE